MTVKRRTHDNLDVSRPSKVCRTSGYNKFGTGPVPIYIASEFHEILLHALVSAEPQYSMAPRPDLTRKPLADISQFYICSSEGSEGSKGSESNSDEERLTEIVIMVLLESCSLSVRHDQGEKLLDLKVGLNLLKHWERHGEPTESEPCRDRGEKCKEKDDLM